MSHLRKKDNKMQTLPELPQNTKLDQYNIDIKQNFTKPPNRYSEAGLVKKLEELGIGRPSTYVSIFTKLEDRNYITIKNKSLIPTSKGKILSKFFDSFFNQFVDYQFTANLEEQLDLVTESKLSWKEILNPPLFISEVNNMIKSYCKNRGHQYVDYFSAMANQNKGLGKELSEDGVHPNRKGYKIMTNIIQGVLDHN